MKNVKNGEQELSKFLPFDNSQVQKFHDLWDYLDNYVVQETALTSLFNTYKENTELDEVLLKVLTLNEFYSAGLKSVDLIRISQHIVNLNIDEDLRQGNWNVVSKIADEFNGNKYISFASKYCNWHNPQSFPIYDQYVVNVLYALHKQNKFHSFKSKQDLTKGKVAERYCKFGNALKELATRNNLSIVLDKNGNVDFKMLDRALWLLGKLCFSDSVSPELYDLLYHIGKSVFKVCWDKWIISKARKGTIKVIKEGHSVTNTKGELRMISKQIGFAYDEKWNTRYFGKKLIEYINDKNK